MTARHTDGHKMRNQKLIAVLVTSLRDDRQTDRQTDKQTGKDRPHTL